MRFLYPILCAAAVGCGALLAGCQSAAVTSAKLYLQENQPERAKEQLEKALETTPENPEIHFMLGKIYGTEGNYQAMAAALDRSLELSSKFSEEIAQQRKYYWVQEYNRGIQLTQLDLPDYAAVREAFQAATIIDPGEVLAWRNLAFAQYRLEDMDAAIQTYRRIIEIAPGDTAVYSNLAAVCLQERRFEEAVDALTRMIELNPQDAKSHVNLGIAHEQLDQPTEAEAAYRRAVELDPEMAMAQYGLGNFFWNTEQYEAARDAYARAVELDPEDQDSRFNLAMTYLRLEDDEGALPLLEQLVGKMSDNGAVWRQLSLIYARQDRVAKSKEADARAKELGY